MLKTILKRKRDEWLPFESKKFRRPLAFEYELEHVLVNVPNPIFKRSKRFKKKPRRGC